MIRIQQNRFSPKNLQDILRLVLPDQGCIEVQRDVTGKEHAWHTHKSDETLIVLDGGLRFYWEEGECFCLPGDVVALPAGTLHGSIALDGGATYLIAFHDVTLGDEEALTAIPVEGAK